MIVRPQTLACYRTEVLHAALVIATGINEHRQGVRHLVVDSLEDHSHLLGTLSLRSRDFH